VDPDLAAGQLFDPGGQVVQRDVHGSFDVRGVPFRIAAHVEDHDRAVAADGCQVGEVGDPVAAQPPARGPDVRPTVGGGLRPVDADPDQLALGPATRSGSGRAGSAALSGE
jgi:hypothetical protein